MIDNLILETLTQVLSNKLGKTVLSADYQTTQLHGGTLGDVKLITGLAKTADGTDEQFKLVLKKQKKWERPGDPQSWRREYDFYTSDFGNAFSDRVMLSWPECYFAAINEDEVALWMEYIDGVSSADLTIEMLEQVAVELGRFQSKLYAQRNQLKNIACFSDIGFLEREHNQWHTQNCTYEYLCSEKFRVPEHVRTWIRGNTLDCTKSIEYNFLRSSAYDAPKHLKQMLIDIDDNSKAIFQRMKQLPIVLCHRDFWIENIFYTQKTGVLDGKIVIIDWDSVGFGYLGEDIASLIVDETETENLQEYFRRLIHAYYKGLSQYMDIPPVENKIIWEMMVLKFGYRIMQEYMFTTSDEVKTGSLDRLQEIYEIMTRV